LKELSLFPFMAHVRNHCKTWFRCCVIPDCVSVILRQLFYACITKNKQT
jgi:hypothetical protein